FLPDKIISSSAVRAKKTAEIFAKYAGNSPDIILDPNLYSSDPGAYIHSVKNNCGNSESLILIGHSPVIEDVLSMLISGNGCPVKTAMPTASVACLESEIEAWQEIAPGLFSLEWLLIPKLLR
ncbi:MAG: hypothetical protein QXH80_05240, partial [Candidatus Nanoarchaeia archaeon]